MPAMNPITFCRPIHRGLSITCLAVNWCWRKMRRCRGMTFKPWWRRPRCWRDKDKTKLSQRLLAYGLQRIVPLPEQVKQTVRHDVKPIPVLQLGSVSHAIHNGLVKTSHRWYDYANVMFDYDGEIVSMDPNQQVVRQQGGIMEMIARDTEQEAQACQRLSDLGLVAPKDPASPLRKMIGAMQLRSQADWLRFAKEGPDALRAEGWRVEKAAEYRFDVAPIEDWYANVQQPSGPNGHAWFDLELGVVVRWAPRAAVAGTGAIDPSCAA